MYNNNGKPQFSPSFNPKWIKEGADKEMVEYAEKEGKDLYKKQFSTSQFRNFYGELKRIQMKGFDSNKSLFYLLKPKIAYAFVRVQKADKKKAEGIEKFKKIFDECYGYVDNQKSFDNLCNLIEAIIAYHKAQGGE